MPTKKVVSKKKAAKKPKEAKPFIKLRSRVDGTTVYIQVLEQTKRDFEYVHDGFILSSCENPSIYAMDMLYLRGNNRLADESIVNYEFSSHRAVDFFLSGLRAAVEAYNSNQPSGDDDSNAEDWDEIY